ncbi:hypothetical protein [Streptomyces sp. HM190]|uniref:hypothetical protein n=1 Tax=Streptomyces sp. HM190 TaxID=2695266 RepID=UPI001357A210
MTTGDAAPHRTHGPAATLLNAPLLALAAFFALGCRLADVVGHRRVTVAGPRVTEEASTPPGLPAHH